MNREFRSSFVALRILYMVDIAFTMAGFAFCLLGVIIKFTPLTFFIYSFFYFPHALLEAVCLVKRVIHKNMKFMITAMYCRMVTTLIFFFLAVIIVGFQVEFIYSTTMVFSGGNNINANYYLRDVLINLGTPWLLFSLT